jgi:hypothetical protein
MDAASRDKITAELDRLKAAGILGEYFVSWHGRSGRLQPAVTVWAPPSFPPATVKQFTIASLSGLVLKDRIVVSAA